MLSRTADNLYWLGRNTERAESMARLLDVSYRMSLLPTADRHGVTDWSSAIAVAGAGGAFATTYGEATARNVIEWMALDQDNPSSIRSCLATARKNARSVRSAITTEMWEALNDTWFTMGGTDYQAVEKMGVSKFFDWVKERSHLFRGVTQGTMLQDDAYLFLRIGTALERADNTARILDVKYHVLLPETEEVGGVVDYYQWGALLRSVAAFGAYKRLFRDTITPARVAELMILRVDMPRSLHACFDEINDHFTDLRELYRRDYECFRLAGENYSRLRYGRIEAIFRVGLHEFLTDFLRRNDELGGQISRDFMMMA